jgi:type III secretory pathway component EscU
MEPHLDVKGASFWIWWGIVLLLTVVALSMAVFDMADLNRQLRAQKRELMREHFDKTFLSQLEREIGDSQKAPKGAATHAQGENHSRR